MRTGRTESRQQERRRKRKKQNRLMLGLLAAAAVCAAGTFFWKLSTAVPSQPSVQENGTEQAVQVSAKPTPASSPAASPLASPEAGQSAIASVQPSAASSQASTGKPPSVPSQANSASSAGLIGPMREGDDVVKLAFVGDVMFASTVETQLKQNGYDYPYKEVKTYLERPDLTIANLETPVSERGGAQNKKEYTYRSSPKALPDFVKAGFDLVNLANNHVLDYGKDALLDTLSYLDKAGIRRVGAGKDATEAFSAEIVESKGVKIAFLGFSRVVPDATWYAGKDKPGVAGTYDHLLPQVKKAIEDARTKADLVVVMAHWGIERKDKPEKYQRDLAHLYVDAGADLVVGGHPHVLQGLEAYKGKWIAYSLGNFIFTTNELAATWETAILEANCGKDRRCDLNVVPILTQYAKPEPMSEANGRKLFERLTRISFSARVDSSGRVSAESSIR